VSPKRVLLFRNVQKEMPAAAVTSDTDASDVMRKLKNLSRIRGGRQEV